MGRTGGKLLIALVACLIQLFLAGRGASEVVDRIVAEVNDDIITMSELKSMAKNFEAKQGIAPSPTEDREIQRQLLETLINRKLARVEAKKRGMGLTDKEMTEALAKFKQRNDLPDDEALNKALSQAGLTLKELKQQISDQIIQARLMAVVGAKVMVPDAEVRKVYEETGKESGVQLHLRIIRLPYPAGATDAVKEEIKQKAEAVLKEAQQGTPFREIGAKLSVTEADLGFVALSDINPNLAERLTSMKPKEFAPIQTPEGFQVIQLAERRSGQSRSFEEAAPEIRNVLMQKEMEKQYEEWVKGLRAKAHIKMML